MIANDHSITENSKNKLKCRKLQTSIPSVWDNTMVIPIYLHMPHFKWTLEGIIFKCSLNDLLKREVTWIIQTTDDSHNL